MFDDRSVNYNIPIPNVANTLSVDVGRLREAIAMIEGLFKTNADLQGADAGFYPDAVNYATQACSRVTITWGLAASRYSDVTYLG